MRIGKSSLRLDLTTLWPTVILAAFGFYVSLVPTPPNDLWWHLKVGGLIFETREVPTTNVFAWTLPADQPFVYAAWLGELVLYAIHRGGGLALLTFVRTLVVLSAFWLVAVEARRRSGSWRAAAFTLAAACLMSLNNLVIRPQIWSFLPFVSYVLLLSCFVDQKLRGRWLLVCPVLMVFWVNAHGAFVLGMVLCGAFTVGEALRWVQNPSDPDTRRRVAWLGVTTLLTGVAVLANPRGLAIVNYVRNLMTDPPSQGLIAEWQSPTPNGVAGVAFFAVILVILLVFAYSRYRPTPTDMLLLLGFLWLAWHGQRYVIWFAMGMAPILAEAVAGLDLPFFGSTTPRRNWANTALACLLFVPIALVQPWWVERMPLPDTYWAQVHRGTDVGPLIDTATPIGATDYLREHPGGKLFNEMGYGSYLIWALPEQGVFIDPRVELYPYEQWLDYIRITRGVRYNEILDYYGADRILLDIEAQEALASLLSQDPIWRLEYEDAYSQIWLRTEDFRIEGGASVQQ